MNRMSIRFSMSGVTRFGLAATMVASVLAAPVSAQQRTQPRDVIRTDLPDKPDYKIKKQTGFNLFANGDLAGTGMKMTGQFGWGLSNLGPCADGFALFECGDVFKNGGYNFNLFELNLLAGTPPSEFRKIRNLWPGAGVATGGGFTEQLNGALFNLPNEWGPADGTLGAYFSGSTATSDGSCRDNTSPLNGYMTTGVSLLAGSTCPDTWAASGFNGAKVISDSAFIRAFNLDKNNFHFDWWKLPPSETASAKTLGDFSTYGGISDHYTERLKSFGSVTNAYTTPPTIGNYPLGLDAYFEAYSFARPAIANVVYWQMLVVNNSAKIYGGAGIDYDSLYMGIEQGFGGAQANNIYYEPWNNAIKAAQIGTSGTGNCNGAIVPPGVSACGTVGFSGGAIGYVVLKSPIGDARNKLLTKAGSPFFNPASPFADDTITFNHGHSCGFGSCWDATHAVSDKRGFGLLASQRDVLLDGRQPGDLTTTQYWRTFRNKDFPARVGGFNTYVPGNWDWNNDGIQDTLHYDTCSGNAGPASVQCVKTWSDTMPGKQTNRQGNVGGTVTAGPFKLKAGDTTSFIFAFLGAPDSSSMETVVVKAIDAYNTFFLGAEPPPVPTLGAPGSEGALQEVGSTELGDPFIQLNFSDAPLNYTDPFLAKFAADIAGTRLDLLNPGLIDSINARSASNFAELQVYKSCDDGATFTADADCVGDPSVDPKGTPIGVGWRAYSVYKPDASGQMSTTFRDANVIGGKTYLYSFVTKSKGFSAPIRDVDVNGDTITRVLTVADSTTSALQRSGPSVAKVYVPISNVAGFNPSSVTLTTTGGASSLPISVEFGQKVTPGTYTMNFGNRFVVHTLLDTTTKAITTQVAVQSIAAKAKQGVTPITNAVLQSTTFAGSGAIQSTTGPIGAALVDSAGFKVQTETLNGFGFLLAQGTRPMFISTSLAPGTVVPPKYLFRPDYPGFTLSLDQSQGETFTFERIIRPGNDTLSVGLMNNNSVQWQEAAASTKKVAGISGHYDVVFAQDAFGPDVSNLLLDRGDPLALGTALVSSLTARQTATLGDTTLATRTLIGAAVPAYNNKAFVAAKFPFTVTNTTFNRPATLAMGKRSALGRDSTVLLGNGNDTVRVKLPDDVWVPGDEFIVLESVTRDSVVVDTTILDNLGKAIQVTSPRVTFGGAIMGCNAPRTSCNPLKFGTPGATGYLPMPATSNLAIQYATPFTNQSVIQMAVAAPSTSGTLSKTDLAKVRVVPNPFIFQSQFDRVNANRVGDPRIIFSGVPETGFLRIYSVSGQYLQQLSWTAADLNGSGDLPYNLRTREGTDLAAGLYIFVITTTDASGRKHSVRGKFVVIR